MKQIKDLGEKEVIWCKTQEECEAIAELLDNEGFTWHSGTPYLKKPLWEYDVVNGFCFYPFDGSYESLHNFKKKNYTIHNAKDFLGKPNEVKQELQDILNEWAKSKFQIPLNVIIRERLK